MAEDLDLEVFRYNPEIDKEPRLVSYKVPFEEGMSVLMALQLIFKQYELAFRCSCNIGYCSICMVRINGKERLPCKTIIKDPKEKITVQPRKGYPVIRDLVIDLQKPSKP
jgi:fumarate reductase iron-sulfur subunit